MEPLQTLNPYVMTQAETMAASYGLKTDRTAGERHWVTSVHNGDWLKVRHVDFGDEPAVLVSLEMLNFKNPGTVDFYLDELGGRPVASVPVNGENMLVKASVSPRATI